MDEILQPVRERHVRWYFGHIYDECLASPSLRCEDLDYWTDTERPSSAILGWTVFLYLMLTLLLLVFPLGYIYLVLDASGSTLLASVAMLGVVLVSIIVFINDYLRRCEQNKPGKRPFLKDWPALVRRFDVSMADCVTGVSRTLAENDVGTRMFSVVLRDRHHEPHGLVMITRRNRVRITIWKHWDDPEHTIVHIAPTSTRRRSVIRRFQNLVDQGSMH